MDTLRNILRRTFKKMAYLHRHNYNSSSAMQVITNENETVKE